MESRRFLKSGLPLDFNSNTTFDNNSLETPEEGDEVKVIDFGKWRAFKMKEDALKAKRERQVYEQDLLDRAEVIREIGQAFHVAKTKLLIIPTAISGIVAIEDDAAICKEIIEGSIREILVELSSQIDAGFGKEERE